MNHQLKSLSVLIYLIFPVFIFGASTPIINEAVEFTMPWEQHPEGVALKTELLMQQEGDDRHEIIQISIRNITNHRMYLRSAGGDTHPYYLDNDGQEISLYKYDQARFLNQGSHVIQPGKALLQTWSLTSDKLELLKMHPFFIRLTIFDPLKKKEYTLKSGLIVLK